jgi:hypothetical protein
MNLPQANTLPTPHLTRRDALTLGLGAIAATCLPSIALAIPARALRPAAILNAISTEMTLIRRSAWDRTPPNRSRLAPAGRYSRITVHHEGNNPFYSTSHTDVARELEAVLGAHRTRRYGDIAYHLAVDYAGRIWEARSLSYEGAHVLSNNEGNAGILLLGNFNRQRPSAAQLAAMDNLILTLRRTCGIASSRVYGHRDLSPSACPGHHLYPYVAQLRQPA